MAKITEALYKDKIIGIETIYTVDSYGNQINIPEKVEALRKLGQRKELICTCGCRGKLMLVAGDSGLREQHFRHYDERDNCYFKNHEEGIVSVLSKRVLKMWLDVQLHDEDLETRVPINDFRDTERKFELTLLSRKNNLGISYIRQRSNISDEKMNLLENYQQSLKVIYVVDESNMPFTGQYPEYLIKIQKKQGYLLFLKLGDDKDLYNTTELLVSVYKKDIYDEWVRLDVKSGLLKDYTIDSFGNIDKEICYDGFTLAALTENKEYEFDKQQKEEQKAYEERKRQAEEHRRKYEEELKARQEAETLRRAELQKEAEEREERRKEAHRQWLEQLQKQKEVEAAREAEERRREEEQYAWNHRKLTCIYCGESKEVGEFSSYGGEGMENQGTCWDCYKKIERGELQSKTTLSESSKPKNEQLIRNDIKYVCPWCGAPLVRKYGRYGAFFGCSNYPKCRYTK